VRRGVLAIPLYFLAVGIAHVALALYWSDRTVGLPRDGQAFTGTMALGAGLAMVGLLAMLAMLRFDGGAPALARGSLAAVAVAVAVVAYTASRGYLMGGLGGGAPCITEPSGPVCAPGGGVYIADAQPDLFVILVAAIAAWALAHAAARVQERR
jgi:hypothetical protein